MKDSSRPGSSRVKSLPAHQSGSSSQHNSGKRQKSEPVATVVPSESEEEDEDNSSSYMDSLEEGRAPLLSRTEDEGALDEQEEGANAPIASGRSRRKITIRRHDPTDYHTNPGDDGQGREEADGVSGAMRSKKIPRERHKTLVAFLLLFVAAVGNDLVLSYVHEYLPNIDPLPDLVFSIVPYWPWALSVSEYLLLTSFVILLTLALCHRHRWVVLRRIATIGALLYLGRCITMPVTLVPKADPNYYCSPKLAPDERTFWRIFIRSLRVLTGLGLSIEGKHTLCGDYIYSGHTVVHVTAYLFIVEYSPKRWILLHYVSMIFSTVGVLCLLVSRGHYTIDVILAYWITTRVFWSYHSMANLRLLRSRQQGRNHLCKELWFPIFAYMEANVPRALPKRYSLPPLLNVVWRPIRERFVAHTSRISA